VKRRGVHPSIQPTVRQETGYGQAGGGVRTGGGREEGSGGGGAGRVAGFVEFNNLGESKGFIRTSFLKQRGVYLWTNKTNGKQYIGSAMDLSSRLSDYFTNSYLKYQSYRGSAISP
jgi:hypothetical protein